MVFGKVQRPASVPTRAVPSPSASRDRSHWCRATCLEPSPALSAFAIQSFTCSLAEANLAPRREEAQYRFLTPTCCAPESPFHCHQASYSYGEAHYLMQMIGTGMNSTEIAPSNEHAGPTPRFVYKAWAKSGNPAAYEPRKRSLRVRTKPISLKYTSPR
jgi:hypothetical protein